MSEYMIRSPMEETDNIYESEAYLAQQQARRNIILSLPLVKMSYNDYLIKRNDTIISINVPDNSKLSEYQQLFKRREVIEEQIHKFVHQQKSNGGYYIFYNWESNDDFICDLPREGLPLLATLIFSSQYQKAQILIQNWPKTIITETLTLFFKGFMNLVKVVHSHPQLKQFFISKTIFLKNPTYIQNTNFFQSRLLLTGNYQSIQGLIQRYETLEEKKQCIISNLKYLKQFLSFFPNTEINDYYKLIFAFMANTQDQLESKNMYKLLLDCQEISLLDRFNFAQKLIPLKRRKEFVSDFSKKVLSLTHLSNLLLFSNKDLGAIQKIISNYLDEYGDLQSVAMVCLEYGNEELMKYIDMFQDILVVSCEEKKAQHLQNQQFIKLGQFCLKKQEKPQPISRTFLSFVNFQEEKIEPIQTRKVDSSVCYVCFRSQDVQDLFIECGRCKHGGHFNHLLKWYEESNNICPKNDCPCYCV